MNNDFYTDEYNNNPEFRLLLNRWGFFVFILILLNWFWAGIPAWLSVFESFNIALWLLVASQKIYKPFAAKTLLFVIGFIILVAAFSKLGAL